MEEVYRHAFGKFAQWCAHREVSALPASEVTVTAFVARMYVDALSPEIRDFAEAAIAAMHTGCGLPAPHVSGILIRAMRPDPIPRYRKHSLRQGLCSERPGDRRAG